MVAKLLRLSIYTIYKNMWLQGFLFLNINKCCKYSVLIRDASNEYHNKYLLSEQR